ncbi:glycoside hydrolase family 43 protein [Tessaracoccus terricola]
MTHPHEEFPNQVPLLAGFWSDPTICRAGQEYVLAHSSFEYFPGAPVHTSTDLLEWRHVGHVVDRPGQTDLTSGGASSGIYGSTIRHHDGRFWFITTNIAQVGRGQSLFTADHPEGPWSDPVLVPVAGIDPDIAWDDDGTCLVTWCSIPWGIQQVAVDPASGELLGEPVRLWSGTGMRNPEGPHLHKVGGWWYLLIAEGGTDRGHSVSVARSRSARGPFEGCPANPILTRRSTEHPVQSVGHADLVEGPGGQWYAVHHGTRPRGKFPQWHVLGRETFLARVEWRDDWPVIVEEDGVPVAGTDFTDTFDGALDPRWTSPSGDLSGVTTGAGLVLTCDDARPRPVVCRVRDQEWSATAALDVAAGAVRLLVHLDDEHWYGIEADGDEVRAVAHVGPLAQVLGSVTVEPEHRRMVALRVSARLPEDGPEPDVVALELRTGDGWQVLGRLDGRYVSTEVAGGFTGRMVGLEVLSGTVVCRSFAYERVG